MSEQTQKSESEFQIDFYTRMGVRNGQIEENARKDELATEEYVKVSGFTSYHSNAEVLRVAFSRYVGGPWNFGLSNIIALLNNGRIL